jgi:hypothetical protein
MAVKGPILVKSIRSLAKHFALTEGAVRKWLDRDTWTEPRTPPWNLERVIAWREVHCKPDPAAAYRKKIAAVEAGKGEFAAMGPLTKARIQATIERALLVRQRRLIEAGEMHSIKECSARKARQVQELRDKLLVIVPQAERRIRQMNLKESADPDVYARLVERLEEFHRFVQAELVAAINEFAGSEAPHD